MARPWVLPLAALAVGIAILVTWNAVSPCCERACGRAPDHPAASDVAANDVRGASSDSAVFGASPGVVGGDGASKDVAVSPVETSVRRAEAGARWLSRVRRLEEAVIAGDMIAVDAALSSLRKALGEDPEGAWSLLSLLGDVRALTGATRDRLARMLLREMSDEDFLHEVRVALASVERQIHDAVRADPIGVARRLADTNRPAVVLKTLQQLPTDVARHPDVAIALEEILRDCADDRLRVLAARKLAAAFPEERTDLFLDILDSGVEGAVKVAMIRSLSRSSDPDIGRLMLAVLEDSAQAVEARRFAASALARHAGVEGTTEALVAAMRDAEDEFVRRNAFAALIDHGPHRLEAVDVLMEIVANEGDAEIRFAAALGLARAALPSGYIDDLDLLRQSDPDDSVRAQLDRVIEAARG